MEDFSKNESMYNLLRTVKVVRKKTIELTKNLEIDDMVIQTANYVSPIKWHLGHTSWFFEKFILAKFCKNYILGTGDLIFQFMSIDFMRLSRRNQVHD